MRLMVLEIESAIDDLCMTVLWARVTNTEVMGAQKSEIVRAKNAE